MHTCQQSLIKHIGSEFKAPVVQTLTEYAGQLSKDAVKLSMVCPAILPIFIEGNPAAQDKQHGFDLLVITENRALDLKQNKNNNLQLATAVVKWLRDNPIFKTYDGSTGVYEINPEEIRARTILNDNRFCVVAVSLQVNDNTD